MFLKAPIKRFNDTTSCTPAPGAYNPKLPELASSAGISFQKSDRFPTGHFAVPLTPSGTSTPDCRRHNGSGSRTTAFSSLPRRMNKSCKERSSSTFSLPILDGNNYNPGEEEFVIHRGNIGTKDEIETEMQDLHSELSRTREALHTTEAERDSLLKKVEQVKQDLRGAETRVVETEQMVAAEEARVKEKIEEIANHKSRIDALQGSLVASKHQQQFLQTKIDELQKAKENSYAEDVLKLTSELEKARKDHLSLEAELTTNLKTAQNKLANSEEELVQIKDDFKRAECVKHELSQQLEQLKGRLELSESRVAEMETAVSFAYTQLQAFHQKEKQYQDQITNVQEFLKASEEEKALLQNQMEIMKQSVLNAEMRVSKLQNTITAYQSRERENAEKIAYQGQVISTVDGKLAEAQRELSNLGVTNDNLQQTVEDLLSQNHNQALDLVQLNEKLQDSLRQTQEIEARLLEESTKFIKIQTELQQALSRAELERKERAVVEETLKIELETSRGKAEYLYSELVNLQDFSKRADDERVSLRQLLKEYTLNLSSGAAQIVELQDALAKSESAEKEKDDKLSKLEIELQEMKSTLLRTSDGYNIIQTKNDEMQNAMAELNTTNINLTAQLATVNEELQSSKNHCNKLDTILLEEKSKHEESRKDLQHMSSQLESERSERNNVENQLRSELESILGKVAQSEFELKATKDSLLKTEEEKDSIRRMLEKFKVGSVGSEVQIVVLEQSVVAATAQLELFQQKELQADAELSNLRGILQNVEEEKDQLNQSIEGLRRELAGRESELQELKDDLVAAELSDQEKDDKIYCQQSKIEVIEENLAAANRSICQLQTQSEELKSLNTDLHKKLTDQAIEVAQLKDELDLSQCQVNELQSHLDNQTSTLNESQHELRQTLSLLENERNEHAAAIARLTSEQEATNEKLTTATQNGNEWKQRYDCATEEKQRHIQRLKMTEAKLGEYLDIQIKSANQNVELRKSSTEVLVLKNSLEKLEAQAKSSKQKLATVEVQLAKHAASSENWKALHDKADAEVQKTRAERVQSQEALNRQEQQIRYLESQNLQLEKLIGPFKEQLKFYKDSLDMEHDSAARQAKYAQEIAEKYADIVGHQNPKQRIHHMQKLKNDNLTLKNDNSVLQKKLTQAQKRLEDLEDKCSKLSFSSRRFDPRQAFRNPDAEDTQNIPPPI